MKLSILSLLFLSFIFEGCSQQNADFKHNAGFHKRNGLIIKYDSRGKAYAYDKRRWERAAKYD
jgi:hypothetical protein